jgi:hypothetical protein
MWAGRRLGAGEHALSLEPAPSESRFDQGIAEPHVETGCAGEPTRKHSHPARRACEEILEPDSSPDGTSTVIDRPHCTLVSAGKRLVAGMSALTTTELGGDRAPPRDGAFMESRGCNRWQSAANRSAPKTAKLSQIRCDRLPAVA